MKRNVKQDLENRPRKIDLDNLSDEEVDRISARIGQKVGDSFNRMCEECRKFLNVYGMDIKVTYILHPAGEDPLAQIRAEQARLKKLEESEVAKVKGKGSKKGSKKASSSAKQSKKKKTSRKKSAKKSRKTVKTKESQSKGGDIQKESLSV